MRDGLDIDNEGTKRWYLNGEYHRTDGTKYWYLNGKRHRTDGPAIEYSTGTKYWYLNGMKLSEEEYLRTTRNNKLTELGI
jgi:hypothetical protein